MQDAARPATDSMDSQKRLSPLIDGINVVFGTPECRWYRVQWEGYEGNDTWETERSLKRQGCDDSIREFWRCITLNPSADFIADPDGV